MMRVDRRLDWWREARFGMFIHWGLYALLAGAWKGQRSTKLNGEWIMNDLQIPVSDYEKLAAQFNPVKYDARAWVRTAKDAGMKYIVITSKHHDGFALWDSRVSDYNVMATPYKRDLLKPLAAACRTAWRDEQMDARQQWGNPRYDGQPICQTGLGTRDAESRSALPARLRLAAGWQAGSSHLKSSRQSENPRKPRL